MMRHSIERQAKRATEQGERMPRRLIQQAKREAAAARDRQAQRRLTRD